MTTVKRQPFTEISQSMYTISVENNKFERIVMLSIFHRCELSRISWWEHDRWRISSETVRGRHSSTWTFSVAYTTYLITLFLCSGFAKSYRRAYCPTQPRIWRRSSYYSTDADNQNCRFVYAFLRRIFLNFWYSSASSSSKLCITLKCTKGFHVGQKYRLEATTVMRPIVRT